jgi:hypothetical protein
MNDRDKYFFLEYLRAHKFAKDHSYIKRDKRMLDKETADDPRVGYKAICQRLMREILVKMFPLYTIAKPRNNFGFRLRMFNQYTLKNEGLINLEPENPTRFLYRIINHHINVVDNKFTELREQILMLSTNLEYTALCFYDFLGLIHINLHEGKCDMWQCLKVIKNIKNFVDETAYGEDLSNKKALKEQLCYAMKRVNIAEDITPEDAEEILGPNNELTTLEQNVYSKVLTTFSCDDALDPRNKFLLAVGALKREAMRNGDTTLVAEYNNLTLNDILYEKIQNICEE